MNFLKSDKINQWFADNEHLDGFWDFVHEHYLYDAQEWDGDDKFDLFERGFELARKAGDKPVYQYSTEDYSLTLYFIGQDGEIVKNLQSQLDDWLEEFPQQSEKEKQRSKIIKEIKKWEADLACSQSTVAHLKQKLADLGK